jgi:hypothetical protein
MTIYPLLVGPLSQRFRRDEEGHRWYDIDWHVKTESQHDSIAWILSNWPLFAVGSQFNLAAAWPEMRGIDPWAFCTPELNISPHRGIKEQSPVRDWIVSQTWSTKQSWRCQTFPIENPLYEPVEMSGDFVHENREASTDRFGKPLRHPNFQPIKGPASEYKYSYPTISFKFNSATLPLSTYVELINHVNDAELWGLPERCVRFTDAKWARKVYGDCFYYFEVNYSFEFDIAGFDRKVPAEGTMCLAPDGNPADPKSMIPCKSATGENINAPLDMFGRQLTVTGYDVDGNATFAYPQYIQTPQVHEQGNLLLLGIPSSLA